MVQHPLIVTAEASPKANAYGQVFLMGIIFCCIPGAFNSITGLHSGIPSRYTQLGYGILYLVFASGSLIAPALVNKFGPRTMMFAGGVFYVFFSLSLLLAGPLELTSYYLVTVAAAAVGLGAALLWTGNGTMLLSYPTAENQASYISTFWVLFNLGAVVGGIQTFVTNLHDTADGDAAAATFWVYIVMGLVGTALVWALRPLERVVREDGTRCASPETSDLRGEIRGMASMLSSKPVLALIPLFVYSNWFYSYQLTVFSQGVFKSAASGLASAFYWGAQMVGAKCLGCLLDSRSMTPPRRARVAMATSIVLISISWIWGFFANAAYHLDSDEPQLHDYDDPAFPQACALMTLWGFCDALVQTWCYWIMTQLYTSPADLGRIVGVFKFAQSMASSVAFFLAYAHLSALTQLVINTCLFALSIPGALYLCTHLARDYDEQAGKCTASTLGEVEP